jgi:undecaprenyl-diphosphatase
MKYLILRSILVLGCFSFIISPICSQNFEVRLLKTINPTHPTSDFWRLTTQSAKPVSVGLPLSMLATGLLTKDKNLQDDALETLGTFAITTATTVTIKRIVNRPRPYQTYTDVYPDHFEEGRSFPSGHTSVAFGTAAALSIQHKQWYVVVPAFAWATAVAYSRLYLGQHYPTDLLGGAITGAGSAWISHKATAWLKKDKRSKTKLL